jgi:hypothetical protein
VTVPAFGRTSGDYVELNSHDQRFMTQTPAIPTSELRPGLHALGTRCLDQGSLLTLLGFSLAADLYPLAVELGSPIESGAMHGAGDGPNISDLRATPATQVRVSPLSRLWQHSEFKPLALEEIRVASSVHPRTPRKAVDRDNLKAAS